MGVTVPKKVTATGVVYKESGIRHAVHAFTTYLQPQGTAYRSYPIQYLEPSRCTKCHIERPRVE